MSVVLNNNIFSLPCFSSASSYGKSTATSTSNDEPTTNNNSSNLISSIQNQLFDSASDQDFDLLAEYLLDDGTLETTPTSGMNLEGYVGLSTTTTTEPAADSSNLYQQAASEAQKSIQATVTNLISQHIEGSDLSKYQQREQKQATQQQQPPTPLLHPGSALLAPSSVFPQANTAPPQAASAVTTNANAATIVHHQHSTTTQNAAVPTAGQKRDIDKAVSSSSNRPSQRTKSQAQIDKRRERNRILARRTRLRKKFFFESLQKEVMDLQRENYALKEIVKKNFEAVEGKNLLSECKVGDLPSILSSGDASSYGENNDMDDTDLTFISSVKKSQQCFVITDPSLHDNPIVFASEDFFTLTGYTREEVLGRNCRFLQGMDTCPTKLEQIRKSVAAGEDVSVCIVNYTSNGTAFWNQLFIAALRDTQGNVVNFIGVLVKVSGPLPNDPEAGKVIQNETGETTEDVDNVLATVTDTTNLF